MARRTIARRMAVGAMVSACIASSTLAQSLYWDANGTTTGAGASPVGIWGTDAFWSTDANGEIASGGWSPNANAIFSAGLDATGAFDVTLSGPQAVGALVFEEGAVSLLGISPATNLTWNGQISVASGASATLGVLLSGSGGLQKSGSGLLSLTSTNDFVGNINVAAGTLAFGNSANASDTYLGAIPGAFNPAAITLQDGAALRLNAGVVTLNTNRGLTLGGATANFDAIAGAILFVPNPIEGPGATVVKVGPGEVGFYGAANNFAKLVIEQGNLRIGQASFPGSDLSYGAVPAAPTPDAITIRNGATNRVVGNAAVTIHTNRGITLGSGGGVFRNDVSPVSLTINSAITGPGGLRKEGGQAFTINGERSYQGPTVINGGGTSQSSPLSTFNGLGTGTGTLAVNSGRLVLNHANGYSAVTVAGGRIDMNTNGCLGTGPLTVSPTNNVILVNSTTLGVGSVSNVVLANDITINSGTTLAGGAVTTDIAANSGRELVLNGKVSGNGSWKKDNSGSTGALVLGNPNNDFTANITNVAGTLIAAADNALGSTAGITVINSGSSLALRGGINYSAAEPLIISGAGRVSNGAISNDSGNNSFSGPVTLAADASVGGAPGTVLTLNGVIGESGGARVLTKSTAGTVRLTADNQYSGGTVVSAGTLIVANTLGSATGPGPVTVQSGATLSGPGSVAGTVTINGTLAPGSSPGTQNTASQIWNGGGVYVWEINDVDAGQGADPGWDLANITGSLAINATPASKFTIDIRSLDLVNAPGNVADFDNTTDYVWTIAKTTAGITGFDPAAFNVVTSGFSNPLGAGRFLVETANSGNDLVVRFVRAPSIAVQPANQTADCATGSANFSVGATGTAPLSFQWRLNGSDLAGANTSTLTVNPTLANTAGSYDVVVANAFGSVTSSVATLTLTDVVNPIITVCAPNQTLSAGANCQVAIPDLTALVTASDNCSAVTLSQLPLPGTLVGLGSHNVTITATDAANNTATCVATVTVNDTTAPEIVSCAPAQTITAGGVNCMAAVPDLTALVTATDACGAVTVTQSPIAGTMVAVGTHNVTLTATDVAGNPATCQTTVTVNSSVTVAVNSPTVCLGGSATLTATTAAANPSFLWSPGGETTPSITVSPASTTTYTVTVTDGVTTCSASASGTVTVGAALSVAVNSATVCIGESATLTATTDASTPTFLWSPGGETTASISVSPSSTTVYSVTVTDASGCIGNGSGTVTVRAFETFANAGSIAINDDATASPYPSVINVSGLTATVCRVTVTLNDLSHAYPADMDVLLVAPNGQSVLLMSDLGGGNSLSGVALTFDDAAANSVPENAAIASGSYKPSNAGTKVDSFPAPAPAAPHGTTLASLSGINPNGAWSLYVVDDEGVDAGQIAGGWSLAISTLTPIADIAVSQTSAPAPVAVGSNLTLNVSVANLGPAGASNVQATNVLPAGVTFVSATSDIGTCVHDAGVVTCSIGSLNAGASATISIVVVPGTVGSAANVASAGSSTLDLVAANNSSSANIVTLEPVVISTPLVNAAVCIGAPASFTVAATGSTPLTYQWFFNETNLLVGETGASLSIAAAALVNGGTYSVVVANAASAATSTATLVVNPLPTVSVNSETICFGASATLTATTTAANPTYLWSPGGATTASISVSPASTTVYTVTVTDGVTGCGGSSSGTVTVNQLTIASALTSVTNLCPGNPVGFSTTAGGTGPFTYAWRKDGVLLAETGSALNIGAVTAADAGLYTVEVSGICNTVTNSATLTVAAPPTIAAQPQSQSVPMGNGVVFSVTATGVGPFTYQWQLNGTDISGATATSLAVSNLTLAQSGSLYSVVVSNCAGTTLSAAATLTVIPQFGISFDFNTPGQYTNTPFNLKSNNWMNTAVINGLNNPMIPSPVFEVPAGGVGAGVGSGALEHAFNQGNVSASILHPVPFDFSLPGKTLVASAMVKIKAPANNNRNTQLGFTTATNLDLDNSAGRSYMTVLLQSTAQPALTYEIRQGSKPNGANTFIEGNNTAAGTLAAGKWYKLTATFINSNAVQAGTYRVTGVLQDFGTDGLAAPTTVATMGPITITNVDVTSAKNLYLVVRGIENTGVDFWDNIYAYTTGGPLFFVQQPSSQSVQQGRQATFRAIVDGEGPYTYQWNRNGTPIAGAASWNYTTPPLTLADDQVQYTVTVTSPNGSLTSDAATITVAADELNVVSAGSVDGAVIGLRFDQPVNKVSAENAANYLINGVAAASAALRDNGTDVLLTPSAPVSGNFSVTVQNVTSLSGTAIGANNSASGTVAGLIGYDLNPLSVGLNGQVSTMPGENYSFGPASFEIKGGGHDIFGNFDGFRFVYTTKTGDFDVKMRVPYLDLLRTPNKAGFAVRPSLDAFGPGVFAGVNPMAPGRNIFEGTVRQGYNVATTSWGNGTACTYPNTWIRFRRVGNTFMRYSSTNGVNWLFDGQTTPSPAFPETVYFGFAVCANVGAGNLQQQIRAELDNYGDFAGYAGATIAITSQPTNVTVTAGSGTTLAVAATVTGGGIPATAGELSYVWQRENGSGGWTNLPSAGATNNAVATGNLFGSDNGAQYRVVVGAPGAASVISDVVTISVTDTAAPTVASTVLPSYTLNQLVVSFSEVLSAATALNPVNYTVTNAAGAVFAVANVEFLNNDPRVVLITLATPISTGNYGVRISNVQDLAGNTIAPVTRTFPQLAPAGLAPVVVEFFGGLTNSGSINDLVAGSVASHGAPSLKLPNDTPDFVVYSNVFGINPLNANFPSTLDHYGARLFTYFVPPTNGFYKFYVRADDFAQFYLNTNAVDSTSRAGATLQLAITANQQVYTVANSRTNFLNGGQRYYMELRFKDNTGGDGATVAVRNDNTVPGQGEVIGGTLCLFPDAVAKPSPILVELYTGQVTVNSLAPNDVGAAFANGGYPDLIAGTNTLNFISRLANVSGYARYFGYNTNLAQLNTTFDNYLGRLYSYFVAPSNGVYRFYIRHDDSGELWMNTNAVNSTDPAGMTLLGVVNDFYDANYRFVGTPVTLNAGQRYYIEGRWRDGTGGDGMTVTVRAGNDFTQPPVTEVAPGSLFEFPTNLSRVGAATLAGITPANPTVKPGESINFIAEAIGGTPPYGLVWLKNGQQVMANQPFYVTPALTAADNGAVFTLMVTNLFGTVTRSSTVTVLSDTTAPTIVSASGSHYGDSVLVTFSEPVEPFTAQQLANYRIDGLTILGADWDEIARNRVSLRTTPRDFNITYTLVVNGVRDYSASGNPIANGTATIGASVFGGQGSVLVQIYTNVPNSGVDWLFNDPRYINNMADFSYYTNVFSSGLFAADTGLNNYGVRLSGLFVAPSNGLYRFFIRGDDGTRLFMNTNGASAAGRVLIARNDGANSSLYQNGVGLGVTGASASPIISLAAGSLYYLEALMKEGGGGDHLEVVMRAIDPNTLTEIGGLPTTLTANDAVVGSFFIAPGQPDANRLVILQSPPANVAAVENDIVTLEVQATTVPLSLLPTLSAQWQKFDVANNVFTNIPGASQAMLQFPAQLADDGNQYRVIVSVPGTNVSYTTTLDVTADGSAPRLIAASSLDGWTIGVCFSEPVPASTLGDNFNYTVNGGANIVVSAQARPDGRSAILVLETPVTGEFVVDASMTDASLNSASSSTNGIVQGFQPFDVGAPAVLGSSFSCVPGEIDVLAGGADIWGAGDQGHLTLTPRYGDFDIRARVQSLTRVDAVAKAGLMVRESTNANARTLHILVNPSQTAGGRDQGESGQRPNPGATTALIPGSLSWFPVGMPEAWVRIQRRGDTYTTFRSEDGVNWFEVGRMNLGFPEPVLLGLATTAHNNAAPATLAEYRNVYIPQVPTILVQPAPASQTVVVGGTVTYSVVASNPPNSGPLVYQWKKDGARIPGATESTLTLNDVSAADAGNYTVWVGNDGGAAISSSVTLTIDNLAPLAASDALSTPINTVLNTPVATLLANDSDDDGQPVSILAVSGLPPVSFVTDFNSGLPAGSAVFGTATAETSGGVGNSGYLRLNPAVASQSGAFVLDELTPRKRVSAFTASFKLRISDGSTEPADGFSFNFGSDLTIGASASAENGVGTGLSFCVDNYRFAPVPAGGSANTSGLKLRYGGGDVAFMRTPTWDRNEFVPVTVSVTAEGKVNVFVNGTNVFGEVTIPWVPRTGRFGFYARAGGQFIGHAVDDLSIHTVLTVETARAANLGGDIFGNAYVDGGFLRLNDAAGNLSGSFIPNELTPGVPITGFSASFKLRIGNGSAEPADGFSFNFANDLPLGATTPAAAENGGGTGFSFCVDNYRFAPYPAGGTANTSGMKIRFGGVDIAGVQIPAWNNTAFVPVSITVDPTGELNVLVDGTNVFGAVTLPWTPAMGRFGLYGRTGGQFETHWVDDLAINVTTAGAPLSFASAFSAGGSGTVVLNNGVVTYTPPGDACGTDNYYYLAGDGFGGVSVGTVTVDLSGGNPQPPVILACAAPRTLEAAANCQALLPDLRSNVGASDCASFVVLQSPAPGTAIGLGATTVTLTVSNTYGLTASCQTTVTVQDTTAPALIACVAPAVVPAGPACTAELPDLRAQLQVTDQCAVTITQDPPPGTVILAGQTGVTFTATDASGNSTNCSTTVTVVDLTAPVISCPANITVPCTDTNGAVVTYAATAIDNCDANPVVSMVPASGSVFAQGTHTVTVIAVDAAGNTNTCSFTVTVTDPVQPVLTVTHVGADVVIQWPQTCTRYVLEETLAFGAPTVWTPVTGTIQAIGADNQLTVPATEANKFYRLKKQP